MADRYTDLANDPNVRNFLNLISRSEGTFQENQPGYNVLFGGGTFDSYAQHPQVYRTFRQTDGGQNRSSAAGAYQITNTTYKDIAPRLGITDFSPESQDRMAVALIERRGALDDVKAGNYEAAINKLGQEWASFPSSPYPQRTNTMQSLLEFVGKQPTQIVQTQQGPQLAVPTTPYEEVKLESIGLRGYDDTTMGQLVKALDVVSKARENVLNVDRWFDRLLPDDLDADLLDLIERT